ncbi:MAG: FHA domain-containing protein [Bacteriovoracaceae bacterium]|nr:FHA domain-containing protein [Bacteriovoracaceae bacterium]
MKVVVLKNNSPINELSWPDSEIDEGFEAYLGRSEDCHIFVDDPLVSRHHIVIRYESNKWILEKLSQISIVSVNGQIVQNTIQVNQGDLIAFPPYALLLENLPGHKPSIQAAAPISPIIDSAQTSLSGIQDDIPPVEEMDATVFIPPTQTKIAPAPVMSEATQGLVEDILSDDPLPQTQEVNESEMEPFDAPAAEPEAVGGLDFNSEEDVIGSDPKPDGAASSEPSTDFGGGDFGGGESTQADMGVPGEADDGSESTRVFQKFASYDLLLFGEFAPYDRFAVNQNEIFIGRDAKKCQIVLNDSEVSSVHAVLKKSLVNMTLEDLNSSNGTLLNGQRINKSELNNGDEFIIGSTTFTVQISSDLLEAEQDRLMPVEEGQFIEQIEEVDEEVPLDQLGKLEEGGVDFSANDQVQEKSLIKRIMKDPKKKRIAIIVIVLLMVVMLLDDEPAKETKPVEEKKETKVDPKKVEDPAAPKKIALTPEQIRSLEAKYKIAEAYVKDKKLDEALAELEQILAVDPEYANAKTLFKYVQEQNNKFKEEQQRLKQEEARAKIREEVKAMVAEAKEAVAQRNIPRAEQLFSKILEKDPENLDVTPLKQEIETWQNQERAKAEAEARKKAERTRMVDALAPGKKLYLAKEWFKAILKLEEFMDIKQMDEDLIKEGGDMLAEAKSQLASEIAPVLGKARSLKEGQDLKGAYETYLEVLAIDPTNKEGLDEKENIREILETRSKKVYREAIISESLSLFGDAKEKLQEVQQISPTDSEYYKKATDKLKNYLE